MFCYLKMKPLLSTDAAGLLFRTTAMLNHWVSTDAKNKQAKHWL